MTERLVNLVSPLAIATDMRRMETADHHQNVSSAVTPVIGNSLRRSDIDSEIERSTSKTAIMRGTRTSTMAIRTTTTRTTSLEPVPSADQPPVNHVAFEFEGLVQAYFDCRKRKRNKATAIAFEQNLENNLADLYDELISQRYRPGKSICFVITKPKAREVWAADFRDRIVHHLLYNKISPRFYKSFIADSCACIPERGTLYAVNRLESKIRSVTQNWKKPAFYLKCDLANFFVSIDKVKVYELIANKVHEPYWLWLTSIILFHDPRENYTIKGDEARRQLVPEHKRLANCTECHGLPIGNLSSQFFANVLLDAFDQYCKHKLQAKHYVRYVDDFILLHESPQWLNGALAYITAWLPAKLGLELNPSKTILQPIDRGVDFVGQVIKPWHTTTRKRTVKSAIKQLKTHDENGLFEIANSYFGLFGQASHSHHDRAKIANVMHGRGYTINKELTKVFRKHHQNKAVQ